VSLFVKSEALLFTVLALLAVFNTLLLACVDTILVACLFDELSCFCSPREVDAVLMSRGAALESPLGIKMVLASSAPLE